MKLETVKKHLRWVTAELAMLKAPDRSTAQGCKDHNRRSALYRARKRLLAQALQKK